MMISKIKKPYEDIETAGKLKPGHIRKPEPENGIKGVQVSPHKTNENDDHKFVYQRKKESQEFQNPVL